MLFQFLTRCSAVRHASAWTVSVGLCAPLVPIVDAPRTPRFGASCEKPNRSTTFVEGLSPIRVPPYACVDSPIAADRPTLDRDCPRLSIPLLHLVLGERRDLALVVLELGGDAADRESKGIFDGGVEIEIVVFVWQRGLLNISVVGPIGILLDERLPRRSPPRGHPERVRPDRPYWPSIRIHPQIAAADEIEPRVVEIVVRPVVDRHALRGQAVPRVRVPGKQRRHAGQHVVAEVMPSDLPPIVR